jgi:thymidylate kinase
MRPQLVCIIGPDGVGKTTQIGLIVNKFRDLGVDYEYRWLRFHHLISLPLLGFARLVGLSEVITLVNGQKIGYHYFYRSSIISSLYEIFLFIDTVIFTFIKIYLPLMIFRRNILCDRFTYDTLVDLMISTGRFDIYKSKVGEFFLKLIPNNSKIIMLIAEEPFLRTRREDVLLDKVLPLKIKLYLDIAKEFNITTIDAKDSKDKVQEKLWKNING